MNRSFPLSRRMALRAATVLVAALLTCGCATPVSAHRPAPSAPSLAQVDVYDRTTGSALPVFEKDGRHYIVGHPGHEYAVRIRNCTGGRILAVTSVDGVNVVSGDTATPAQSGYVIEPWGSVEISGWRKSMSRTAAFFFTEHSNSYAARTGRPFDVGVLGVAVFAERARPPVRISELAAGARADGRHERRAEADTQAPTQAASPPASATPFAEGARDQAEPRERENAQAARPAPQPLAKLGTGHGRNETSYVRQVAFERATIDPAQLVSLQYDRNENLVALGVLSAPPHHYARRAPQPFPGMRFVPDPR